MEKETRNVPAPNAYRGDAGFALIIVLLITAILVAFISELVFKVYASTARSANFKDSQRASLLAENGVNIAGAALEEIIKKRPNLVIGEEGLRFSQPAGEGMTVDVVITDERSKASLMVVYTKTGLENPALDGIFKRLLERNGLPEALRDALADWIDSDDEGRRLGAEGPDFYSTLKRPYAPRNDYPGSLDELLMVKGFTPAVHKKLAPYVTAYTDGLVNINTAPKVVLTALSDEITDELAARVVDYRNQTPFKQKSDIMKVHGFETIGFSLQDKIAVDSKIYRVVTRARAGDVQREAESVIQLGGGVLYWREF